MPTVLSELQAGVLALTLNRPERANAFTLEMLDELRDAFGQAGRDPQTRVIVLSGAGKAFSAGQDIGEMRGGTISYREHLRKTYNPLVLQIRRIEKPVIAALNGPCAGAALGIALACDLRVASEEARLVVGFGGIGLVPDSAVSLLLPAVIGIGRAQYYFMTNLPISSAQALEWGLVNCLFPSNFMQETMSLAMRLAAGPLGAYGIGKRAFNMAVLSSLEEVLNTEAELQEIAGRSPEHKEGVAAFLERRPPKYN